MSSFLDKLLGRGKQAADKGKDIAGEALDKGKSLAAAGLDKSGDAMKSASGKLSGGDQGKQAAEAAAGDESTASESKEG